MKRSSWSTLSLLMATLAGVGLAMAAPAPQAAAPAKAAFDLTRPETVALRLGSLRASHALLKLTRERAQRDDLLHPLRGLGPGLLRLPHLLYSTHWA